MRMVYDKHPPLEILHSCPLLRSITLEQYLIAKRARSKFMDFKAACTEIARRAELQGNIAKPGAFLDSQLAYWEKDHKEQISKRRKEWREYKKEFDVMVDTVKEYQESQDPEDQARLDRMCGDFAMKFGHSALTKVKQKAVL